MKSNLSQRQRILYDFQRSQLIDSDSESASSDQDKIEALKRDLASKNELVKTISKAKIEKILMTYTQRGTLNELDTNLLLGYYVHQPQKEYSYYQKLKSLSENLKNFQDEKAKSIEIDEKKQQSFYINGGEDLLSVSSYSRPTIQDNMVSIDKYSQQDLLTIREIKWR